MQSNVTTRVKNLEQRLGVQLFRRQNGRLTLSPDGKLRLAGAERLLAMRRELRKKKR